MINCAPQDAKWYFNAVVVRADEDVTYMDTYFSEQDYSDDLDTFLNILAEQGYDILESSCEPTPRNLAYIDDKV